jgi:hypothetical protein
MVLGHLGCHFVCPGCEEHVFLPRESHLGTFSGLPCQPRGEWPIRFLCLRKERLYSVASEPFHLDIEPLPNLDRGEAEFWEIECECVRQNCRQRHTIYTKCSANEIWPHIRRLLIGTNSASDEICAVGHTAEFREDRIQICSI